MAKFTRIELTPDDPIFTSGVQVFRPVPRPSPKKNDDPKPTKEQVSPYEEHEGLDDEKERAFQDKEIPESIHQQFGTDQKEGES